MPIIELKLNIYKRILQENTFTVVGRSPRIPLSLDDDMFPNPSALKWTPKAVNDLGVSVRLAA